MSRRLSSQSDTGAALVLVLGLISVMSTAAVFSFDSLSRLIQNNLIEQQRAQARHYALAAEQISIKQLRLIITEKQNFGFITRSNLNRYDYTLEKATLNVVATDISNCFNVNALVSGSNIKGYVAAPGAIRQFAALLQKFGIGETAAMGLSSALADWQDTNNVALPLGAESTHYTDNDIAYRTPNAPVRSITELRLIRDFTPELLDALGPLICAGGIKNDNRLNVSTFEAYQAPVISILLDGHISDEAAMKFLADKELGRFASSQSFFKSTLFDYRSVGTKLKKPFMAYPNRVRLSIESRYGDTRLRLQTEVSFDENGTFVIIGRKFGV